MNKRSAEVSRKTNETDISTEIIIDGNGIYDIDTGIAFFDHMLELFSKHGLFDIKISARGDLDVDYHHTVEDVGITLGTAFDKALGERKGIIRCGLASVPMDEARVEVAVDLGGRPFVKFQVPDNERCIKQLPIQIFEEFFRAFAIASRMNIHIRCIFDGNTHHVVESMFKSFARAMDQASSIDPKRKDNIPSTKGVL